MTQKGSRSVGGTGVGVAARHGSKLREIGINSDALPAQPTRLRHAAAEMNEGHGDDGDEEETYGKG